MIIKKFVPCIYLYHEHAVRNLTDTTIVDTDPVHGPRDERRITGSYHQRLSPFCL